MDIKCKFCGRRPYDKFYAHDPSKSKFLGITHNGKIACGECYQFNYKDVSIVASEHCDICDKFVIPPKFLCKVSSGAYACELCYVDYHTNGIIKSKLKTCTICFQSYYSITSDNICDSCVYDIQIHKYTKNTMNVKSYPVTKPYYLCKQQFTLENLYLTIRDFIKVEICYQCKQCLLKIEKDKIICSIYTLHYL